MKGTPRGDRRWLGVAWLLASAAFAVSAWNAWHLTWVLPDAANYAIVARSLLRGDGYTENIVPFHAGPYAGVRHLPELHGLLRPLVLVPLFALFGTGPFVIRVPGLVSAVLTAMVVFVWGRRAFGTGAALLACVLTLTNVSLVYCGLLATDDAGFALFFTATVAVLWRALAEERDGLFLGAGVLGALALLEKPSGILVPLLLLVPAWHLRTRPAVRVGRWLGLFAIPFLLAVGLYVARNIAAGGGPGFRFAVLGWILKSQGYEGMMALYEAPPSLADVLRALGPGRAAALVRVEIGKFLSALAPTRPWTGGDPFVPLMIPTLLPTLALAGIPLFARQLPAMAALFGLSLVGALVLLGICWQVETRFLSFLVPLVALWASAVVARGARSGGGGWPRRVVQAAAVALGAWLVVASGASFVEAQRTIHRLPDWYGCRAAIGWLAEHTAPGDRILTFDPWFVAWTTDREAVMIPTGGREAIARVARRYDVRWLLAHPMLNRQQTGRVVVALEGASAGLNVATAYEAQDCRVLRLEWPP